MNVVLATGVLAQNALMGQGWGLKCPLETERGSLIFEGADGRANAPVMIASGKFRCHPMAQG